MQATIIISLLKNPLNGGIPEIDIDAINEVADVAGVTEVTIRNRYKELTKKLNIDITL